MSRGSGQRGASSLQAFLGQIRAPVRTAVSVLLLLLQAASPCALATPLRSPLLAAFTVVRLAGSRRRRGGAHSACPPAATPSDC